MMCHSKLAKRGALLHSENTSRSICLPGKEEGYAEGAVQVVRQFPNIFRWLSSGFLALRLGEKALHPTLWWRNYVHVDNEVVKEEK